MEGLAYFFPENCIRLKKNCWTERGVARSATACTYLKIENYHKHVEYHIYRTKCQGLININKDEMLTIFNELSENIWFVTFQNYDF